MKKTLAIVLALMLALGVYGGFAVAESDGTVTACIGSQPETIDPQMNSASDGSNYIKHLFEGLMKYGWNGEGIVNGVAESYTISDDGLTWTFKIRDDAKWSDGVDLTADDFVYSFQRLVDPATAAPYAGDMGGFILNGLEIVNGEKDPSELGVKAIDAKTLEVKLSGPCAYFTDIMAFPTFYPVRKDIIDQYGSSWITSPDTLVGNGAYKLESWTMDDQIVMVPNENYYDASKLVCKRLVFKLVTDPNAIMTSVRTGEILWADTFPQEEMEALKAEGLYNIEPQLGTYYVNINNTKAPFDNPLVRKAFTLAIDTDYLGNTVLQGAYLPATNFVGPGFYEADGTTEFCTPNSVIDRSDYEANKKAAQEALAEAGYPNGEGFPTVEYITNVSGIHQSIAEALAYMWKDVLGVNVTVSTMDWNVFLAARRNGEHVLARDGWVADYNDPSNLLNLFTSYSGNNSTKYNNPDFDALMQEVAASSDQTVRMEKMHEAEQLAFGQDYAAIPVLYYSTQFLCRPELTGVTTYPTGEKLFFNAQVNG
jgi:oligopeptide transport system substrate-binding protein